MSISNLIPDIHYCQLFDQFFVDPQFDITNYPYHIRLELYVSIHNDLRLRQAFPFSVFLTMLNNDPDLKYIPSECLSVSDYEEQIIVCPKDPETGEVRIPNGYRCVISCLTSSIAFPVLRKLLESDYAYYVQRYSDYDYRDISHTPTLSRYNTFCRNRRTRAYYGHALIDIPNNDLNGSATMYYVDGLNDYTERFSFYSSSKDDVVERIKRGCDPCYAKIIVQRFFDPYVNRLPDFIVNSIGSRDDLKREVVKEWTEQWNKYNPGKLFFVNAIPPSQT